MTRLLVIVFLLGALHSAGAAEPSRVDEAVAAGDFGLALNILDDEISQAPGNTRLRFRKAQVLRYDGQFGDAIAVLDALATEFPDDVDYVFERALCRVALGEYQGALDDLDLAIRLSPDYEDPWALRFRLLSRDTSLADEDTISSWRSEAEYRFPDAAWHTPPAIDAVWSLSFGGSYDELDSGFDDWNRQFIGLVRDVNGSHRHALELSRNARSSNTDYALYASADYTLASNWQAGANIGVAANPVFMPKLDLAAHGGRVIGDGWVVDLGVRFRDFTAGSEVLSTNLTVEKYIAAFRAAYRLSVSTLPDSDPFSGHGLTLNWFYSEAASLGVTVGTGREVESLGGGRLLETDVRSMSVTGRQSISDKVSLDWWLGFLDQGDLYRRRFVGLAVSIQL